MNGATNYCRVCLVVNATNTSLYLQVQEKYLPAVIENISGVEISSIDEPEAVICMECSTSLVNADHIIQKCQESHMFHKSLKHGNIVREDINDECLTNVNVLFKQEPEEIIKDEEDVSNGFVKSELDVDFLLGKPLRDCPLVDELEPFKNVLVIPDEILPETALPKNQYKIAEMKKTSIRRREQYLKRKLQNYTSKEPIILGTGKGAVREAKSEYHYRPKFYFRCEHCHIFESNVAAHAITHLKTVHGLQRPAIFRCDQCNAKPFIKYQSLQEHIATKHKLKLIKNDVESLSNRECIPDFNFRCELCHGYESNVATHAITHLTTVHGIEKPAIFRCLQCDSKPFIKKQSLQEHIATKHEQKPKKRNCVCQECGKTYLKNSHLQKHLACVHKIKEVPYQCHVPSCRKGIRDAYELRMHMKQTHGLDNEMELDAMISKACDKFVSETKVSHEADINADVIVGYACVHCRQNFHQKSQYDFHINDSKCKRSCLECLRCDKTFVKTELLEKHQREVH